MALSIETLRGNTQLAGLTTEQLTAISEMSVNDENNVIASKIGALHSLYDTDILSITGVAKNAGEKSYDYMKRVLSDYKTSADSTATTIASLTKDKAELERKLADNSADAALKQKLADTENRLTQLQAQYDSDKVAFAKTKADFEKREKDIRVGYVFDNAIADITFKEGITDSIKSLLIKDAKAQILANYTPEFTEDGAKLIFRDKNGQIYNNPNNNLNPYTAKELFMSLPTLKDVIGTNKTGGGTEPPRNTGGSGATVPNLSKARTQVEADNMIADYLMQQGLTRYSTEFVAKAAELRNSANVDKLPIR